MRWQRKMERAGNIPLEYQEAAGTANRIARDYEAINRRLPGLERRALQAETFYYDDYRELPEEEDAWAVGAEMARRTRNL